MKSFGLFFVLLLSFYSVKAQQINAAEYFYDTDPGVGNGISIPIADPAYTLLVEFSANTEGLNAGDHILYIRTRTEDGVWSLTQARPFTIISSIVAAEYFIDTDPGVGNGTSVVLSAVDDSLSWNFNVSTQGLSSGQHILYVRSKSNSGTWSLTRSSSFTIQPSIVAAEYFVDTDPGVGNGTALTLPPDDSLSWNFEVETQGLSVGLHTLYVRSKSNSGTWSLTRASSFTIQPSIVAAEYFVDTDPGVGNGTALTLPLSDDSLSWNFEVQTQGLPTGTHTLYVRTKSNSGTWSLARSSLFTVQPSIVAAEYFVDTDPGVGNGIVLPVSTTGDSISWNFEVGTIGLSAGAHSLYVRSKSNTGTWSLAKSATFTVQPSIIAAEYFVDTDPGAGNGIPVTGFSASDSVSFNLSIPTDTLSAGLHRVYIRTQSATGTWSLTQTKNFEVTTDPVFSIKVFLEGFYLGSGLMQAVVDPIGRPAVCDTVTVLLANAAFPHSIVHSQKVVLNTNGSLLAYYPFPFFGGSYYLIIKHRNSIATWSKFPVYLNKELIEFDFTTGPVSLN